MIQKEVLFWFQGRGRPYKGFTPNVETDSKSLISGLSIEVSFITIFHLGAVQIPHYSVSKTAVWCNMSTSVFRGS